MYIFSFSKIFLKIRNIYKKGLKFGIFLGIGMLVNFINKKDEKMSTEMQISRKFLRNMPVKIKLFFFLIFNGRIYIKN